MALFGGKAIQTQSRAVELGAAIDNIRAERSAPRVPIASGGRNVRRFDAAIVDRLTASWITSSVAIDFELRTDLNRLRSRARDMAKNNEYAKKFLRMVRNNVVGAEGFKLQCRAADPNGDADAVANKAIEAAFAKWAEKGNCEITGKLSFNDACRLLATGVARDGEILVRRVRGAGPFGYQIQLLDIARLDTLYNVAGTKNSNSIIMGVEVDPYRRPVAYHMWTAPQLPGDFLRYRERIPASEIIHEFIQEEAEQTRGFPWMHAAMRRMNDLNGYREAAVIAARIGASKMGFFTSPDGLPPNPDGVDDKGNLLTQVSPGELGTLPSGYDFKAFDPTYPHDQFDAFTKATLRGIASAIGVSYNSLANDLEGVNFSSMRAGVIDERDEWMVVQNWFTSAALIPIFRDWLEVALMRGDIKLPNGKPLPAAKLAKFNDHLWQGRRWQWVDPMKDIEAAILAINNGLTSPQQIAAQTGRDVEDVLDEIAKFQEMLAMKNITLMRGPLPAAGGGSSSGNGDGHQPAANASG